jgi:hypothetical protein
MGKVSPIAAYTTAYYLFIQLRITGDIEENPGFAPNGTGWADEGLAPLVWIST